MLGTELSERFGARAELIERWIRLSSTEAEKGLCYPSVGEFQQFRYIRSTKCDYMYLMQTLSIFDLTGRKYVCALLLLKKTLSTTSVEA